ncbi:metallophosphoesterase [Alicyclobacillus sp. SO9]|uniref:metallophosphoesterase family protein n=1 Tax=Alicyclobacillus sp. SO9 TaxID=2665646 RepID=UPI0018E80AF1|nr:metallophosphoesterase [Alicyclobacillus sp. SO9]QQE78992.1 metallophosphoesterase [Alicyclobacillus sp. SO9]
MALRIALIGDLHYPGMLNESADNLSVRDTFYTELLHNFFMEDADLHVSVGDVTHKGNSEEWKGIERIVQKYPGRTFRFVLGNHDVLDQSKHVTLEALELPRYFVEETRDARLIYLDTTRDMSPDNWGGFVDEEQLKWLQTLPRQVDKPTLVFAHHPIHNTTAKSELPMMNVENSQGVVHELDKIAAQIIYMNGHNHIQSIAKHPSLSQWDFVQTASVVSSPCFRVLEVTPTSVAVTTKHLATPTFQKRAAAVREIVSDYWHDETAPGGKGDQSIIIDRKQFKKASSES